MHLATLGWDDYFSRQFESLERDGLVPAASLNSTRMGTSHTESRGNGRPRSRDDSCMSWQGSSGVGKSTIINRLLGEDRQEVQSVSNAAGKGRHTTTSRSLLLHPDGGMIIDMPGMRELLLWASEGDVEQSFTDIELLAGRCRFKDCTHTTEPGCGVLAALDNGSLDEDRYRNYMKLQKEVRRFQHFQELREHCGQRRGMTHGEESKRCFLEVIHYVSRVVPGMDALPWWKNAAS